MTTALAVGDLTEIGGEPRILDLVVAERLGYEHPGYIRKLIGRHRTRFERHGELRDTVSLKRSGGRPQSEYWLNEHQTILACILSRTDKAAEVQDEVIRVFVAFLHGQLERATPARAEIEELGASRMRAWREARVDLMRRIAAGDQEALSAVEARMRILPDTLRQTCPHLVEARAALLASWRTMGLLP